MWVVKKGQYSKYQKLLVILHTTDGFHNWYQILSEAIKS